MFNYNHLYYFYITAKCGGVTQAAKFLHVAQPALSSQMHTLEKQINCTLFQKSGRRMILTNDGERILAYCRRMFEISEELQELLKGGPTRAGARFTVAVTDEIERPFAVDLISAMMEPGPPEFMPRISMISGPHAALIEALKLRETSVMVTNRFPFDPSVKVIGELPAPVFLCAGENMWSDDFKKKRESANHILRNTGAGLVLPLQGSRLRSESEDYLIKYRLNNPILFEGAILAAVVRAAIRGLGMGLFPLFYVQHEIAAGSLVRLGSERPLWQHQIFLIVSAGAEKEPLVQLLKQRFDRLTKAALDICDQPQPAEISLSEADT